jgi:hypothetical protein
MFRPHYSLQRTNSRNGQKPIKIGTRSHSQWRSSGQFSFCGSSVSWCSILVSYSQHNLGLASDAEPSCKLSPFPVRRLSGNAIPGLCSDVHVGISSVTITVFLFTARCCFSFKALVVLVSPCLATCSCYRASSISLVFKRKRVGNLVLLFYWIKSTLLSRLFFGPTQLHVSVLILRLRWFVISFVSSRCLQRQ